MNKSLTDELINRSLQKYHSFCCFYTYKYCKINVFSKKKKKKKLLIEKAYNHLKNKFQTKKEIYRGINVLVQKILKLLTTGMY